MKIDDLTMGELRDIVKTLGLPMDRLGEDALGLTAGIVWIVKRREDSSFTFDQALAMSPGEIQAIVGDDETDPKD